MFILSHFRAELMQM